METRRCPIHVRLGPFFLDLKAGELRKDGRHLRLQEQPFRILKMLVERPLDLVTREDIQKELWPDDTIVEFDQSINAAMRRLRDALGDNAEQPRYIETVSRRGYRLKVPVEWLEPSAHLTWSEKFKLALASLTQRRMWAVGLSGALLLLLIAFLWHYRERLFGLPVPEVKKLAVLPSYAEGSDPEIAAFANGLIGTLAGRLGQLTEQRRLEVIPASEMRDKGVTTVDGARKEFGVNLVLRLSLQRLEKDLRISVVLLDARAHQELRAKLVTGSMGNPFTLEDKVADAVVEELELALRPEEQREFQRRGTEAPGAYQYYLQGLGYLLAYERPESVDSAILVFKHALEEDPHFASASAGLGEAYWRKYQHTHDPLWVREATTECSKAVAIAEAHPESHKCLGVVFDGTGQYAQALREYGRAEALDPSSDEIVRDLALTYEHLNCPEEAEATYCRAIALRPQYWRNYNYLGAFYLSHGRYKDAAEKFQEVVSLSPDSFYGYSNLGATYIVQGFYNKAIPVLEQSLAIMPTSNGYSNLVMAHYYLGDFVGSERIGLEALNRVPPTQLLYGNLADVYYWGPATRGKAPAAYQKAITLAKQELQVNPNDATILSFLAYYSAMLGEKQAALSNVQMAVQDAPMDPEVLFYAGLVFKQLGDTDGSLKWLGKAISAGLAPNRLRVTPNLVDLSTNSRFRDLLRSR